MDDLLALAESLDVEPVELDDLVMEGHDILPQQVEWYCPPRIDLTRPFGAADRSCSSTMPETIPESDLEESPTSPAHRNRVALFGESDKPTELTVSSESSDPRCFYVMDHPGRNAQFKYWFLSGLISDDSRRVTFREESAVQGCWEKSADSRDADDTTKLLNLIRVVKPDEPLQASHPDLRAPSAVGDSRILSSRLSEPRDVWESRCFMVGASIMVAMSNMDLDDSAMRTWCMWFNDKLCGWGISDRPTSTIESRVLGGVSADLDFSCNRISVASLEEVVRLTGAFKRIHVRTLRISSNFLTHKALVPLKSLPYLCHLVMDDNLLVSEDLIGWIREMNMIKQEQFDILLAQDTPDETVKLPLFISAERNRLSRPLDLIYRLNCQGVTVCLPETTGCEPHSICRLYGNSCGVHLSGLCRQKDSRYI
jgi:hypothetical protein